MKDTKKMQPARVDTRTSASEIFRCYSLVFVDKRQERGMCHAPERITDYR